jgi:hypothetical protein
METLISTPQIIDTLGGNTVVARTLKTSDKVVSNWKTNRKFPANSYLALKAMLASRNFDAPDALWAMRPVPKALKNGKPSK